MKMYELFISTASHLELSPIALSSLVLFCTITLWGLATLAFQSRVTRNQSWYKRRCVVLSERHKLNTGEKTFLRKIRKTKGRTLKLKPSMIS
jgi:hypothetical protein